MHSRPAGHQVGNVVRRLVDVGKSLPLVKGTEVLTVLHSVVGSMEMAKVSSLVAVFEYVTKEGLSFCDASYLTAAAEGGYRLVTGDEEVLRVARKYLDAPRSSELA